MRREHVRHGIERLAFTRRELERREFEWIGPQWSKPERRVFGSRELAPHEFARRELEQGVFRRRGPERLKLVRREFGWSELERRKLERRVLRLRKLARRDPVRTCANPGDASLGGGARLVEKLMTRDEHDEIISRIVVANALSCMTIAMAIRRMQFLDKLAAEALAEKYKAIPGIGFGKG